MHFAANRTYLLLPGKLRSKFFIIIQPAGSAQVLGKWKYCRSIFLNCVLFRIVIFKTVFFKTVFFKTGVTRLPSFARLFIIIQAWRSGGVGGAIKILQHYWQLLERGKFFIVSAAQLLPPTHPPYFAVFLSVANCQLSIRGALVEKSQFLKGFFFKVSPFQGSSLLCLQLVANNLSCASLSRFFRLVFTS